MNFTFENLPQAVSQLCEDMAVVKQLLLEKPKQQQEADQWFDIDQLSVYTRLAKPTIYGRKDIPCHKQGKRLMYLKSEIDNWLKEGRKLTHTEAAIKADEFLSKKKSGGVSK